MPRAAGACEGKELNDRTQQRNGGMKQTFWEICPPLKPIHSSGCSGGRGASDLARALHDVRLSAQSKNEQVRTESIQK
jgi:hypothetical protein